MGDQKQYNIPIFDSLAHPTINGLWIESSRNINASINDYIFQMEQQNIIGAFAVGMEGIGNYSDSKYIDFINSFSDKLIPIGFFELNNNNSYNELKNQIQQLKQLHYKGIKLHPRIGKFNLLHPLLPQIIKMANDEGLVVLLCTYFYECGENVLVNTPENLHRLLVQIPDEKLMLLHSGTVRLMEMVEIARNFKNILLDLSFTINKYVGSSLDMDIQYLFSSFDRHICVGSDFPEFSLLELRKRFDFFARNISTEKAQNIGNRNILNFLKT